MDRELAVEVERFIVPPRCEVRPWNYSSITGDSEYPCWIVFEHSPSLTGIAYCGHGFGPESPWGLIGLEGSSVGLGMGADFQWHPSLELAFLDSFAGAERVMPHRLGPNDR